MALLSRGHNSNKIYPINIYGTPSDRLRPACDHDRAGGPVDRRLQGGETARFVALPYKLL